jgi:hypothetical protein
LKNDETLPNINKPKHPNKGRIKRTEWEDPHPKRQKNHLKGQPQKEHQVLKPPPLARSISNKENGGPPKRTLNLEEPSSTAIARFKIETICACYNVINTLYL